MWAQDSATLHCSLTREALSALKVGPAGEHMGEETAHSTTDMAYRQAGLRPSQHQRGPSGKAGGQERAQDPL